MSRAKQSMDGNTAAAHVAYAFTDVAAIYPITPSSPMADYVDQWSAQGQENIFGNKVKVVEMQSEAGAAGTVHGSLAVGALTTTFTASQGLLLMIPNMYKIAGEQLPCVFDVSARTVATQSLNIFGDHSDVYACRQTGFAMLCETNPQEVMDLSPVAHLASIEGKVPFLNFFDGFRTSHEIQKIEKWDYADLKEMCNMDAVKAFREHALNPEHPAMRGSHENGDVFFQHREACNSVYNALPAVVEKYMGKINEKLGTNYDLFNYYGAPDADRVIVAMGSICDVAEEVIDYLTKKGEKVGLIKVRLYRPWVSESFLKVLPATAKKIAVLDRTKEPGALGEPLYLDVATTLREAGKNDLILTGGRYGLGSKDTPPSSVFAVYKELEKDAPKSRFTIGIVDDVTNLSLPEVKPAPITAAEGTVECKFWGLGGDGTVGANKNSTKIIGDHTDKYIQAYFQYDSKKTGGITISHLRFGDKPIRSPYYINQADFVACHNPSYVIKGYKMVQDVKPGGIFMINCQWSDEELEHHLPAEAKRYIAKNNVQLYTINAIDKAIEIGMGKRTNTILQSAFFKLANVMPIAEAIDFMKAAAKKSYGKKGDAVVEMNYKAIDAGKDGLVQVTVDPSWANLTYDANKNNTGDPYFDNHVSVINSLDGYDLPVSNFLNYGLPDGSLQSNVAFKEKRTIAVKVPKWDAENCIQCGFCSFVCPHATIRPVLLTDEEIKNAPKEFDTIPAMGKGVESLKFRIQVSPANCVGCGLCAEECPGKAGKKALTMVDVNSELENEPLADYMFKELEPKTEYFAKNTIKGSQFLKPYFEVSGACPGCGEAPYYKLVSQLFGRDMLVANATGCSMIYCSSAPSTPFVKDKNGEGVAWANSLFEDNAEYGYGMAIAQNYKESKILSIMEANLDSDCGEVFKEYIAAGNNRDAQRAIAPKVVEAVKASSCEAVKELLEFERDLVSKSIWIVGGDGWAYDIGYGGLDHVLANNVNVNVLVLDTEVYSNTGGQSSKSSQAASIAKFAAGGKATAKKDLGQIAMAYGHVYVASVSMGANRMQLLKALQEAESYDGPSLVIAYCPCAEQGIRSGLASQQKVQANAVKCGYTTLYRFDPRNEKPLTIDSKEPNWDEFDAFLMNENRYNQLPKIKGEEAAKAAFAKTKSDAQKRYKRLVALSKEFE